MIKQHRMSRELEEGTFLEKGFTLIELLIVIVVLGILAAVVVFALGSVTGDAKKSACNADANTVATAVQAFDAQNAPNNIAVEGSTYATYNVTLNGAANLWSIGASVKDTATNGTVVNGLVNGNGGVVSHTFMTLLGANITPGMQLTISSFGTFTVLSVVVGSGGSGISVGNPATYGASGTQAAQLVSSGNLNSWPSSTNSYAISLSTTQAGRVTIYTPANSTTGVDWSSQGTNGGCNSL